MLIRFLIIFFSLLSSLFVNAENEKTVIHNGVRIVGKTVVILGFLEVWQHIVP